VAEWLGKGLQNPLHRFNSGPRLGSAVPCRTRALSSGVERFLDAEEARGSNPLAPTEKPQVRGPVQSSDRSTAHVLGTSWAHWVISQSRTQRLDAPEVVCPTGSRSEASPVAAAWVPLSNEGDDVEVKGFALPITGSHLLVRLCLPSSPLDIPLPSGLRLRPMSIRQRCQGVAHRPPNCFAFLTPKAKLTLESISECTKGMPHH
jgi:hypothetical protein